MIRVDPGTRRVCTNKNVISTFTPIRTRIETAQMIRDIYRNIRYVDLKVFISFTSLTYLYIGTKIQH